jgi:hypothetical protein
MNAHEHATAPDHKPSNPIVWGAYLACSWTWCIGMFMPALLLRDSGWVGYLVFAIPNVIGAAAMGWVLTSRKQSQDFVAKHPQAIWWFSVVTVAFHVFWVMWVFEFLRMAFPMTQNARFGLMGAFFAFWLVTKRSSYFNRMPQLASVLWILSFFVLAATFVLPDVQPIANRFHEAHPSKLIGLTMLPLSIFGFLLCPYLDVTFHHARQQLDTKHRGRIGFTIGFAVMFALMIVLTTRYAPLVIDAMNGQVNYGTETKWLGAVLLGHILFQWVFTMQVHMDRVKTLPIAKVPSYRYLIGLGLLAGLIGYFAKNIPDYAGMNAGEIVYRCFMGAYGLLFPTYVLYRVVLARNGRKPMPMGAVWAAIILVSPMFWMGFIEGDAAWLITGMAVVFGIAGVGWVNRRQSSTGSLTRE